MRHRVDQVTFPLGRGSAKVEPRATPVSLFSASGVCFPVESIQRHPLQTFTVFDCGASIKNLRFTSFHQGCFSVRLRFGTASHEVSSVTSKDDGFWRLDSISLRLSELDTAISHLLDEQTRSLLLLLDYLLELNLLVSLTDLDTLLAAAKVEVNGVDVYAHQLVHAEYESQVDVNSQALFTLLFRGLEARIVS